MVTDMVEGGLTPDEATYAGILHACQRANEAELAFDVLRCFERHLSARPAVSAIRITPNLSEAVPGWPGTNSGTRHEVDGIKGTEDCD